LSRAGGPNLAELEGAKRNPESEKEPRRGSMTAAKISIQNKNTGMASRLPMVTNKIDIRAIIDPKFCLTVFCALIVIFYWQKILC
jgi:hypothetical protein